MRLRPRGAAACLSVIRAAGQCFSRPSMSAFFYAHACQQKSAAIRRQACGARPGEKASPARWKARTPEEKPPFGGRRAARGQERKHLLPDGRHARQRKSRHSAAGVRRAARRERRLLSDGRHARQRKTAAIRRQACNYFMEGVPQDGAQKRFRGGYYGSI